MLPSLRQEIDRLLSSIGLPADTPLTTPPKLEMGDLAVPCFALAKEQGKNPAALAQELAVKAASSVGGLIAKVEAQGPFVNAVFDPGELARLVLSEIKQAGDAYGNTVLVKPKKILIEYPSQNTHKEFHIGHVRNTCIGNTLVQLYRKAGYEVMPINYLNDFGAHVVKCLWGIKKFHANEEPPANKQRWLGQIYAEANGYLKSHPEDQDEVDDLQVKLERRDPSVWSDFEKTRAWSIAGFEKLHEELKIKHEAMLFESDLKNKGQEIVDELLSKGIASVGERGAIIVDLTPYKLEVALLRKSTGAGLYMTADLVLAEEKFRRFPADESITITGFEQNFYFAQLFKILELAGFRDKITHIGYGLVTLPEGKMSSRSGNVILYEDLRNAINEKITQELLNRHSDWSQERAQSVSLALTLAVVKYTIQKHEAAKTIVFNLDEATSFEGMNAPYILYAVARMNSLLRKAGVVQNTSGVSYEMLGDPREKRLLTLMAGYGDMLAKALENYNPSVAAKYCFDLAQAFNDWYAQCPIISDDAALSGSRLALTEGVRTVLVQALRVLTIETVDEM